MTKDASLIKNARSIENAGSIKDAGSIKNAGLIKDKRADLVIVGVEVALVAAAVAVGMLLNDRGVRLWADTAPIFGVWRPHAGWGTPVAVAVAAVVVWRGVAWAREAPWGRLLVVGYLVTLAWTLSLAFVDGWSGGLAERLTSEAEYLNEVPRVDDIGAMLAGFADKIVQTEAGVWSTHTAGHPPGALLVFVWLDRIGLGGGGPAALACVLAGATVTVSVPVALRSLGAEAAARAVVPFLVLFPGAVWVGASADAVFAAVVAAGLALLAARRWWCWPLGGVVLGFALYLSYGFVLVGILALAVVALRHGHRAAALGTAAAGVGAVVVAFTAAGFWWLDGYRLVVERYYQGWAADRPYTYWVWANLAALVLCAGPAVGPALRRSIVAARGAARWLPVAGVAAIAVADLSGLSKAEVERIWLPFAVWLMVATAALPDGHRRAWLIAQSATALAVNHLIWTWW